MHTRMQAYQILAHEAILEMRGKYPSPIHSRKTMVSLLFRVRGSAISERETKSGTQKQSRMDYSSGDLLTRLSHDLHSSLLDNSPPRRGATFSSRVSADAQGRRLDVTATVKGSGIILDLRDSHDSEKHAARCVAREAHTFGC